MGGLGLAHRRRSRTASSFAPRRRGPVGARARRTGAASCCEGVGRADRAPSADAVRCALDLANDFSTARARTCPGTRVRAVERLGRKLHGLCIIRRWRLLAALRVWFDLYHAHGRLGHHGREIPRLSRDDVFGCRRATPATSSWGPADAFSAMSKVSRPATRRPRRPSTPPTRSARCGGATATTRSANAATKSWCQHGPKTSVERSI